MEKLIYKDYSVKIKGKLPDNGLIKDSDINEFVALLNFCFQKRNNFFIKNFNKRVIKNVYISYNQLKTNILTPGIEEIFGSISVDNIKLMRFIAVNFVNNYEEITTTDDTSDNDELCLYVSKDGIKRCLQHFTTIITNLTNSEN